MIIRTDINTTSLDYRNYLKGDFSSYQKEVENLEGSRKFLLLADLFVQQNRFPEAEEALGNYHDQASADLSNYQFSQACMLAAKGKLIAAYALLSDLMHRKEKGIDPLLLHVLAARLELSLGNFPAAKKHFSHCRAALKGKADALLHIYYLLYASEFYTLTGALKKSESYCNRASELIHQQGATVMEPQLYHQLALLYRFSFVYDKSSSYAEKACAASEHLYGSSHTFISLGYYERAMAAFHRGQFDKMQKYNRISEKMRKQLCPENLLSLGQNLAVDAFYYRVMGKTEKAMRFYNESIRAITRATHRNNPELCTLHHAKAMLKVEHGDYKNALDEMLQATQQVKKARGDRFTGLIPAYNSLAECYLVTGERKQADFFLTKSTRLCETAIGKNNVAYTDILKLRSGVHKTTGNPHEAEKDLAQALKLVFRLEGNESLRYSGILYELAVLYKSVGVYDKSVEFFQRCIELDKKLLPANHPAIITHYTHLCEIFISIEEDVDLEDHAGVLSELVSNLKNRKHPILVSAYEVLAQISEFFLRADEALSYINECIKVVERISKDSGAPAEILGQLHMRKVDLLLQSMRYQDAVEFIDEIMVNHQENLINSSILHLRLSYAMRQLGMRHESVMVCQTFLNQRNIPDFIDKSEFYLEMALSFSELKDTQAAKNYFKQAIQALNNSFGVDSYHHIRVWEHYLEALAGKEETLTCNQLTTKIKQLKQEHLN